MQLISGSPYDESKKLSRLSLAARKKGLVTITHPYVDKPFAHFGSSSKQPIFTVRSGIILCTLKIKNDFN